MILTSGTASSYEAPNTTGTSHPARSTVTTQTGSTTNAAILLM